MVSISLNAATIDAGHLSINCSTSVSVFFSLTLFQATIDFKISMSQGVFQGNNNSVMVDGIEEWRAEKITKGGCSYKWKWFLTRTSLFFLFLVAITRTGGVEIGCKETLNSYKTNTILVTYQNPWMFESIWNINPFILVYSEHFLD